MLIDGVNVFGVWGRIGFLVRNLCRLIVNLEILNN